MQLTAILNDEDIMGVFVWQFADCRVDEELFASRPGCKNNKGVVDEYRRKKLAFAVTQKHFLPLHPSAPLHLWHNSFSQQLLFNSSTRLFTVVSAILERASSVRNAW